MRTKTSHPLLGTIAIAALMLPVATDAATTETALRRDFNGDGRADVLFHHSTGQSYLWFMDGLDVVGQGALPTMTDTGWQVAGIGDFDGDGHADVFWHHAVDHRNYVTFMNGTTIIGQAFLPTIDAGWRVVGIGDFNGDGQADVLWRHTTGQNYVWFMNGTSILSQGSLPSIPPAEVQGIGAIGDFNGDGKSDIVWNRGGQDHRVWLMNGLVVTVDTYLPSISSGWSIAGAFDLDNDGKADLLFRHLPSGQNYVWFMNGTSIASQGALPTIAEAGWYVAELADFNGDGKGDVFWHNSDGRNGIWLLDGLSVIGSAVLPTLDIDWAVAGSSHVTVTPKWNARPDFNGNGTGDVLFRHPNGQNQVWLLCCLGAVSAGTLPALTEAGWSVGGMGDFDGDGKTDILWTHTDGRKYVWFLDGFNVISDALLPSIDPGWSVAGIGDFNGDGRSDILFRHTSGQNYLWVMSGSFISWEQGGGLPTVSEPGWSVAGVGDLDGDGKADVVWHNVDGRKAVWLMDSSVNGVTVGESVLLQTIDPGWSVAAVRDFNNDGKADIFLRHANGYNYLWFMNGATIAGQQSVQAVDPAWSLVVAASIGHATTTDLVFRNYTDGRNFVWTQGLTYQALLPTVDPAWIVPSAR